MRGGALAAALAFVACAPGAVLAQGPSDRLGDPSGPAAPEASPGAIDDERPPVATRRPPAEEAPPWLGPQVQLGFSYFRLVDGFGGGDTYLGVIGLFIHFPVPQVRLGVFAEGGARRFALGGDDFIGRAEIEVGYQLTELAAPLLPYITVVGTGGGLVGRRFSTTTGYGFGGGGIRLGADLHVVRNLSVGASLTYLRLEMDGAAFNVWQLRVVVGL